MERKEVEWREVKENEGGRGEETKREKKSIKEAGRGEEEEMGAKKRRRKE